VYAPGADGKPVFHALPRLSTSDVADVLQAARARIVGDLRRRGVVVIDDDRENTLVEDDGFSDREPALAHLAAAAVSGAPPPGRSGAAVRRSPCGVTRASPSPLP
jgi:hypothetical protein